MTNNHKTIELKASGETITFLKTTEETNGEYLEILVSFPAGAGPATHKHSHQTELFESVEGKVGLDCGDDKIVLQPGESFEIPADTWHRSYSIDGDRIKFKAKLMPAASSEYMLTEMFAACNRQQSKEPSAFDACYILHQTNGDYYIGDMPVFVQKTLFPVVAWLGRLLGTVKARPRPDVC